MHALPELFECAAVNLRDAAFGDAHGVGDLIEREVIQVVRLYHQTLALRQARDQRLQAPAQLRHFERAVRMRERVSAGLQRSGRVFQCETQRQAQCHVSQLLEQVAATAERRGGAVPPFGKQAAAGGDLHAFFAQLFEPVGHRALDAVGGEGFEQVAVGRVEAVDRFDQADGRVLHVVVELDVVIDPRRVQLGCHDARERDVGFDQAAARGGVATARGGPQRRLFQRGQQ